MSTREEHTSSSQTRGALEGRALTVLSGRCHRHDCPCSISHQLSLYPHHHCGHSQERHTPKPQRQRTVLPITAPVSSWVSPQLSLCLVQHSSRSTGIQSGNSFDTAGYPSPQADQGCSRYFSSFLDSSTSEAGVFLGHEGVLQALQRMRKRMRMSNTMTQLKEIATIAPVERVAAMATVPQESAGPTARSHAWNARAAMECAASTYWHWLGTKGMAMVLAVGLGWGQAGSRTVSPHQFGRSLLCPRLHHTTGKLSLSCPCSGRAVRTQGSLLCLQSLEERKSQSPWACRDRLCEPLRVGCGDDRGQLSQGPRGSAGV